MTSVRFIGELSEDFFKNHRVDWARLYRLYVGATLQVSTSLKRLQFTFKRLFIG
jgi:hypothetical protein